MSPTDARPRAARRRDQRGVATIWAVGFMSLLILCAGFALGLARAAVGLHRVDAAADLAAIAGAQAVQHGRPACESAGLIATANGAELRSCRVVGSDVIVRVAAPMDLPFGVRREAVGEARAGPG